MNNHLQILPLGLLIAISSAWAVSPDRIAGTIDNNKTVVLKGASYKVPQQENDLGPLDPATKLPHVTMLFEQSVAQKAALKQLLEEQQDQSSPNYQKWLTPEQFGDRFGLSRGDIRKITNWLRSEGFTISEVARGRNWVAFSGTVEQIQRVFRTEIHRVTVDGEERFANVTNPSVPKSLEGIVSGFRGLDNFKPKSLAIKKSMSVNPDYSDGSGHTYLAPGDIATIYDIGPLYTAGIDGTGMKIAVMGQTDIHITDIQQFRAGFNLPANDPTSTLPTGCTDPGFTGDEAEADLDLEWSGAVARNASIIFVICDITTNSGVISSLQAAVNNTTAPVLSMSYGICESKAGQSFATSYETLIQQANAQGQTLMVSSGDSGAAMCDKSGNSQAAGGLAVNAFASPPEVTAVGGTELNEGTGTYWNPNNGTDGGSAISYIPELAWDDSSAGTGLSTGLWSGGGGASIFYPKPAWQTGTGTFDATFRSVPDVSMPAAVYHDAYIVCTNVGGATYQGSCANGIAAAVAGGGSIYGGTSVACPVFAGVVALLNQSLKNTPPAGLGNMNKNLYALAARMPTAFHDVPAGTYNFPGAAANPSGNVVPCTNGTANCTTGTMGFLTGTGYDEVTGLGSVDAHVLVTNWAGSTQTATTTTLAITPGTTVAAGTSLTLTATVNPIPPDGESVTFFDTTSNTALGTANTAGGRAIFTSAAIAGGSYMVVASYPGDTNFAASASTPAQALNVQDISLSPTTLNITVTAPGQSGSGTVTYGLLGGLSTPTFSCSSGLPSESSCSFAAGTTANTEVVTVSTQAPSSSWLHGDPLGRGTGIYYALLLPGLLGLALPAGRHRRRLRTVLGFLALLAALTLGMPACGGSGGGGGGNHNPGTPVGQSNVVLTATSSGVQHNITINLNVQ